MVDFSRLRSQRKSQNTIYPEEIFLRLPKSAGLNDLWNGQAETLRLWFERRREKDIVIKLNTGGGKTLVGLLIAQSILNERQGPVIYLCPTTQLRDQILDQSQGYGIATVPYISGQDLPEEFLGGEAVMIATYPALFNGRSKFGVSMTSSRVIRLEGIILDDAHTAFSDIRERFTLTIDRTELPELYEEITALFRTDFTLQNRQGTYDDVVSGEEQTILEVPYVSWADRAEDVRRRLTEIAREKFPFVWPLIRDSFDQCHALISKDGFAVTPLYPQVSLFPSFSNCPHRVYMSATFADDSSIIRTFGADLKSVSNPISPVSLAGVGERMILAAELMPMSDGDSMNIAVRLARDIAKTAGVVILVPSIQLANNWEGIATKAVGEDVSLRIDALRNGKEKGPIVFPNRYDGIDLPSDSCRLLIVSGLPQGSNLYDLFRAAILEGSESLDSALAQRVEQGMGRGTRGSGDHCVVLLIGSDLVGWVSRKANLRLLTNTTQAQIIVGKDISTRIETFDLLSEPVNQCLRRASDWTEYHANALADATSQRLVDEDSLKIAAAERHFFAQFQGRNYIKASRIMERFTSENTDIEPKLKGWLYELAARAAHFSGDVEGREILQHKAYHLNKNLRRPDAQANYMPLVTPTKQALGIVDYVERYALAQGALVDFEQFTSFLVPTASSNQFEEALRKFGGMLGFAAERPEKESGLGPDVLWILDDTIILTIEVKSKKKPNNALNKEEHGQLLQAAEWVQNNYPRLDNLRVVVHPNRIATRSVSIGQSKALTLTKLAELVGSARILLKELVSEPLDRPSLEARCESRLRQLLLSPDQIVNHFLAPFTVSE